MGRNSLILKDNNPEVIRWAKRAVREARRRSRESGVPFDIHLRDILSLWTGTCDALGLPLRPGGKCTYDSPSLDRLVPGYGYVPGNLSILSVRANRIKDNATAPEIRKIAEWLEQQILSQKYLCNMNK